MYVGMGGGGMVMGVSVLSYNVPVSCYNTCGSATMFDVYFGNIHFSFDQPLSHDGTKNLFI